MQTRQSRSYCLAAAVAASIVKVVIVALLIVESTVPVQSLRLDDVAKPDAIVARNRHAQATA